MLVDERVLETDLSRGETVFQSISDLFDGMQKSLGLVVHRLGEIATLMAPEEKGLFDSLVEGTDVFNTLADGRTNIEGIFESINKGVKKAQEGAKFDIFKALIPETQELVDQIGGKMKPLAGIFGGLGSAFSGTTLIWVAAIGVVIAAIVALVANWDKVKAAVVGAWEHIAAFVSSLASWVCGLFSGINDFMQNVFLTDWTEHFGALGGVLGAFFANVENYWNALVAVFRGIIGFISSVFAGDWKGAWEGIVGIFSGIWNGLVAMVKVPINLVIGVVNGLLQLIEDVVNAIIGVVNGMSMKIPDWEVFGDMAGAKIGFQLGEVDTPQIPYLAQGAVLPANEPFMAVVGDQKHGTNVEAPLATIQEAVANVMADMLPAMVAGFEAVVTEQRALRGAVEELEIGDQVIGQAAQRYAQRMAVIRGGAV